MTTVARSTVGAAGLSLVKPYVMPPIAASPTITRIAVRIFFLIFDFGGRFMSILLRNYWRAVQALLRERRFTRSLMHLITNFAQIYSSPGILPIQGLCQRSGIRPIMPSRSENPY